MITVPSQQFTVPVKIVKNMHEAFSNYNALEPYDVEICRYKKGFGVVIYQLNYCILKNEQPKRQVQLFSCPPDIDNIHYQWLNDKTLSYWFFCPELAAEFKYKLSMDDSDNGAQIEGEY